MVFSSIIFMYYFLPLFVLGYYILPDKFKNMFFLTGSILFYVWGEVQYLPLILASIIGNYIFGLLLDNKKIKRQHTMIGATIFNLLLIGIFKYTGFFIDTFNTVFSLNIPIPNIRLPLGISFFTFQALSYVIDAYRKEVPVQKKLSDLALYVIAFPQLIAGPIVRYSTVNDQIAYREHTYEKFYEGIKRFLIGLAKKTLLANSLGALADLSFNSMGSLTLVSAWLGVISYTFQIYYDFSGYSDMAIGLGKMFGFEYEENFDYPYISKSITEFWRRWHISLGTWFKDYVYIPLGGNRVKGFKNVRNLFIVWFLTGMWHGSYWNYIVWGLYFGFLIFVERQTKNIREKIPSWIKLISTFFLVAIGWVFFRIENIKLAIEYLNKMFVVGSNGVIDAATRINLNDNAILLVLAFLFAGPTIKNVFKKLYDKINLGFIEIGFYVGLLLISTIYLVNSTYNPFIYFRF